MKIDFIPYNKSDISLGDIYAYTSNEGDCLVEVKENEDKSLYLEKIKGRYWKGAYDYIPNDYLTDFEAVLVFRIGRVSTYYKIKNSERDKRYLVLEYERCYPLGGLNDKCDSFDTVEEAIARAKATKSDFADVYDRVEGFDISYDI